MSAPPIMHGSFVIERRYPVSLQRLYAAWIDPALKARWFDGPQGWQPLERSLDVRVGGSETLRGRHAGPPPFETLFSARYHAVQPEERLVYVYDMHVRGAHHSLSLATVEFAADAEGAKFRFTEQVAFLDGTTADKGVPSRRHGTDIHFDRLARVFA